MPASGPPSRKRQNSSIVSRFVKSLVMLVAGVAGGLASAWYMVEAGSRLSTRSIGPWTTWVSAGRIEADPYTRAHFARSGSLPLSSSVARIYTATTDQDGRRLYAECEYVVEGDGPDQAWWTIAIFDHRGRLIRNPAARHAYNATTVLRDTNGRYTITLAREARPGNWLPTGRIRTLALVMTVFWSTRLDQSETGVEGESQLPTIRRTICR